MAADPTWLVTVEAFGRVEQMRVQAATAALARDWACRQHGVMITARLAHAQEPEQRLA